nr:hypothetical protein [Tanacetum cinerariifolium]
MLFAKNPGKEDERDMGREAQCAIEHLGTRRPGQQVVTENQIEMLSKQLSFHVLMVVDQGGVYFEPTVFQREQRQFGIMRTV